MKRAQLEKTLVMIESQLAGNNKWLQPETKLHQANYLGETSDLHRL